jgi:prolyl oligopeptidase
MRPALLVVAACVVLTLAPSARAADPAPEAAVRPVTDTYHGISVSDPYRWLEDGTDPAVKAWTAAETARTRAFLDAVPSRPAIRERLATLIKGASGAWYDFTIAGDRLFAMHADPKHQQPVLMAMGLDANPDKGRVVIDPNGFDAKGGTSMDWFVPSPDGTLIGAALSEGGSEVGDLHLFDAKTGKETGEIVPHVQNPTGGGNLAWRADGRGFWYTRYPGEERPPADRGFYQQLRYHALGGDPAKDPVVLGEGLPRIAEIKLDNRFDPSRILVSVLNGDGGQVAHYVIGADGKPVQVTHFDDQIRQAAIGPDGSLYLVARQGSPAGRIFALPPGKFDLTAAKVIVPETSGDDRAAIDLDRHVMVVTKDRLYVAYVDGGPSEVRIFHTDGTPAGKVPLPAVSSLEEMTALPDGDLLLDIGTYTRPLAVAHFSAATDTLAETPLRSTSPVSFDDSDVVRGLASSKDGTKIPFTVIRRKDAKLDGSAPTLLSGYGGYGVVESPRFLGANGRLWLDAGGILVEANIRGGGEYGEAWHHAGSLLNKQNVFDDFAAVAEELFREKITSSPHLALEGGSNGGLLMGAMITQHPDLARAVVSWVGLYDMLRVELDANGEFNTTEFGTVKDQALFKALYAYSPYHHVVEGTHYPAVLMITGENDGRVNALHSRKMIARLQAATAPGAPIFLETRSDAGHGIGTALDVRIDQMADAKAFLFDALAMSPPKS